MSAKLNAFMVICLFAISLPCFAQKEEVNKIESYQNKIEKKQSDLAHQQKESKKHQKSLQSAEKNISTTNRKIAREEKSEITIEDKRK